MPLVFYWPTGRAYKTARDSDATLVIGDWYESNWIDNFYRFGPNNTAAVHTGSDLVTFGTSCAGKPVYAIADGLVVFSRDVTGTTWRELIVIQHKADDGTVFESRYAHLGKRLVNQGQRVVGGQQIGTIGNAFGALPWHLHADICVTSLLTNNPTNWPGVDRKTIDANYVDPLSFLTLHHALNAGDTTPMTNYLVFPDLYHLNAEPQNYRSVPAVMLKATQGVTFRDEAYPRRRAKAQADGALVEAHHYLTGKDPVAQANYFLDYAQPDGKIVLGVDFEDDTATLAILVAFVRAVRSRTNKPMLIYTRANLVPDSAPAELAENFLWLASSQNVPVIPKPWKALTFQQYAQGPLPGITGVVDLNRAAMTLDDMKKFWADNAPAPLPVIGGANTQPFYVNYINGLSTYTFPDPTTATGTKYAYATQVQVDDLPPVNGYVHITSPSRGWMAAQYLSKDKPIVQPSPVLRYVNTPDGLNVRAAPSLSAGRVGGLPYKMAIQVYDQPQNGYVQIAAGNYKGNWTATQWLSVEPPATVAVIPAQIRGFGPHFLNGQYDAGVARKYNVVKVMDNPGALASAVRDNPNRLFIHRRYNQGVDQIDNFVDQHGGPAGAAAAWFAMYRGDFETVPQAYHEGPCESFPTEKMIAFELERAKLATLYGWKVCVLNLGVGHTSDELWARSDVLALMKFVQDNQHLVGLHCYGEAVITAMAGAAYWRQDGSWSLPGNPLPATIDSTQSWLAFRIIQDRKLLAAKGITPMFCATELGIDDCSPPYPHGVQTRGWKSAVAIWQSEGWLAGTDAIGFYRKQLQYWVDMTGLPGCVYAHGDRTAWRDIPDVFNTEGVL